MGSALENVYPVRKNTYKSSSAEEWVSVLLELGASTPHRDETTMDSALVVGGPGRLQTGADTCAVLRRLNNMGGWLSQKSLPYHWSVTKTLLFMGRTTHGRCNRRVMNDSLQQ